MKLRSSAGGRNRNRGFAVSRRSAGTRITGVVRCDQARALDLAARGGTKLERLPAEITADALMRLMTVLS